jgi:hypothetical protein
MRASTSASTGSRLFRFAVVTREYITAPHSPANSYRHKGPHSAYIYCD